ncbi:PREDICTED: origin recognition complex subunit 4 [Nicrophorus vespilloides]|uniref:Origin recognition complex subunit 4 n=1 Tax=Nicrophorus vespilloides TaxID=110193 RepID=A0ABM1NB40_NICVS|nr:PREDICTED: origin recognition complex subunit 4 [Nicrophorus vespilloides]
MDSSGFLKVKNDIKNKLLQQGPLEHCESERKQVFNLLQRTIEDGESNSALLIGPRGSGKTTLVNDALEELCSDKNFASKAVLVHLHGLIHTDDRLALIAATKQMNLDNAVDGKVFGSFAENLAFLLACLRTGNKKTSKSVLFIIEDFDLFCSHHNQTLLYNLFDISQSAQAPICVLGITCRLDVIELLEKRVKSRFSHRQYFLYAGGENAEVDGLNLRMEKIRNLLTINNNKSNIVNNWNKSVSKLCSDKKFRTLNQRLMDIDLNERTLKNVLLTLVSKLKEKSLELKIEDFETELNEFEADEVIEQLHDLSVLELCLLISMKHHIQIYDNQPMNFEMVYTRFVKFANASSHIQNVQRPVVMKAFEHIKHMELIQNITGGSGRLQKEYQMFKLLVTSDQIMESVKGWQGLPTEVSQWAISSLI